jgi:hypothetical protein
VGNPEVAASDDDPRLYRFLYLDFERVRSLAAMLFGGVPEQVAAQKQQQTSGTSKANIGVPFVGGAELGGEVLYLRSERETRSLHHGLLRATLRRLEELARVADVDDSATKPPDGQFVRLTGEVVIRDYVAIAEALDTVGQAYIAVLKVQQLSDPKPARGSRGGPLTAEAVAQRELERVMKTQLPAIREAIAMLFGDVIRVYCQVGERIYVGSLARENMFERPDPGLNPTTVGGLWTVLCDVSFGEGRRIDLKPALSEMEAAVESLIEGMKGLAGVLRPSEGVDIRPIAIYREL